MNKPSPPGAPRLGTLGALTLLVVLAHMALLRGWPARFGLPHTPAAQAWAVREVRRPPAAAPATPPVAPKPAPAPRRLPPPPPAQPTPPSAAVAGDVAAALPMPEIASISEAAPPAAPASAPLAEAPTAADTRATPPARELERQVRPEHLAVAPSVRLLYDVSGQAKGFNYSARSELLWRQDGQRYDARVEVSAFLLGSRVQTSTGQLGSDGLEPTRFSDKLRSEQAAHFERDQGKVVFSANTPEAPLLQGAQDRLSVLFQLAAMLAGEPQRYPPATTITLPIVGPRDADTWLFTVGEPETLHLPGGELATLKLTRNPRAEYDQRLELWLAPSMGYLPVRLRLSQANGDVLDQQWRASEAP